MLACILLFVLDELLVVLAFDACSGMGLMMLDRLAPTIVLRWLSLSLAVLLENALGLCASPLQGFLVVCLLFFWATLSLPKLEAASCLPFLFLIPTHHLYAFSLLPELSAFWKSFACLFVGTSLLSAWLVHLLRGYDTGGQL